MKRQKIDLYLRLLFLFLGTLAAMLSLKTYISDSEFWAITASRQLGESGVSSSIYVKFLFYGLLKLIYLLPLDNISHVLVARLEFALIGAITAYVFYRVARLALEDEFAGLLLTLVLVTSTYFLSQSFRVRSDNLSSLFALLIFWILLRWSKRGTSKWIAPAFGIFALNILLLITTPKAFYFLILGGLFASLLPFSNLERRRKILALGVAFLAPVFAITSTVQIVSFFPAFRWVERAAIIAFEYFNDSFNGLSGANSYLTFYDFNYVFSFIAQNPLHDLFFVTSAWLWAKATRQRGFPDKRAYLALFVASIALLIFHNQKLPFFIYAMLPLLTLGAGFVWKDRLETLRADAKFLPFVSATLAVAAVITLSITIYDLRVKSNSNQIAALHKLQNLVHANSDRTYYDAIGLLPRSNTMFAFPSPNDRNNSVIMKVVENSKPDLLFYVLRFMQLEPRMSFFLGGSYVDVGGGVWARAVTPKRLEIEAKRGKTGTCEVKAGTLLELAKETFKGETSKLKLVRADLNGYKSTVADEVAVDRDLEWKCGRDSFALIRVEPKELKNLPNLRYLFGFDIVSKLDQPLR